ncbi:hypothetical protein G6F57_022293 [Rhizopus arrhizus]|nr:hypothetical protein G6F57_022293 [Rhizopus arrhizus]
MLKEQLGAETMSQLPTLLIDNVPELASFLKNQPYLQRVPTDELSTVREYDMEVGEEIKMRFHSAFIQIFQAMVSFKFVTLFLEDLHEADKSNTEKILMYTKPRFN